MNKNKEKTSAKNEPALPDRLVKIDLLKGLAIIAVILIHTWAPGVQLAIGAPFHIYHAVALLLLVAGFTGTYSYMRRGSTTLSQCYDTGLLYRRYSRLLKPYILMFILEIVILFLFFRNPFDAGFLFISFLTGGYGLGAYFVPVIFQSVIIVPVLYLIALKNPEVMLAGAFVINVFMEILVYVSIIPADLYAICYARFLFAGALGVWLALSPRSLTLWTWILGGLSALYIGIIYYTQILAWVLTKNVLSGISEAFAYIWTYVLALAGYIYLPRNSDNRVWRGLEQAGKASWHIFLIQMVFFQFRQLIATNIQEAVLSPVYYFFPLPLRFTVLLIMLASISIIICAGLGWLWYRCESLLWDARSS